MSALEEWTHDLGDDDVYIHAGARVDTWSESAQGSSRYTGCSLQNASTAGRPFSDFNQPDRVPLLIGIISLVVLAVALLARYGRRMEAAWRWIYAVSAVFALYLNVFVAVVQSFLKIPPVHALAPRQKEPPFLVVQLIVMAIFVVIGICSVKKFHNEPVAAPAAWRNTKAS